MDHLCAGLGFDPLDFRGASALRRLWAKEPTTIAPFTVEPVKTIELVRCEFDFLAPVADRAARQ